MKMMELHVAFTNNYRATEEPMGYAEEFDSMEEFIQFNLEQIAEITCYCPEYKDVAEKLKSGDYEVTEYEDDGVKHCRVTVRDIFDDTHRFEVKTKLNDGSIRDTRFINEEEAVKFAKTQKFAVVRCRHYFMNTWRTIKTSLYINGEFVQSGAYDCDQIFATL